MPETPSNPSKTIEQLRDCLRVLDDKKAADIQVIEVGDLSSLTDYVVLASATSEPHLRALRGELSKVIKDAGIPLVGVDYSTESGWLVVDAFDFMIHVFLPAMRESYRLEGMWRTAPQLDVDGLLGAQQTPQKPAAPTRKKAIKKPAAAPKKPASKKVPATKKAPVKKVAAKKTAIRKASAKKTPAKKKK